MDTISGRWSKASVGPFLPVDTNPGRWSKASVGPFLPVDTNPGRWSKASVGPEGRPSAKDYSYRTHRSSSNGDGGFPDIKTPTRKILAASQIIPSIAA